MTDAGDGEEGSEDAAAESDEGDAGEQEEGGDGEEVDEPDEEEFPQVEKSGDAVSLRIGGGSPGSSVQVASTAIADLLERRSELARATVTSTDGAGANVRLTENNEVQMSTSVTTAAWFSLNGLEAFDGEDPYENWRAAFMGYTIPLYFVTHQDSGIDSWSDLEGKRLGMGPRGSGVSQTFTFVINQLGLDADLEYIPYDEGNQQLADGAIDAHMLGVNNFPAAIEAEAMMGDDIKWIGIEDPADQEAFMDVLPALSQMAVDSSGYETLDEDIDTVGYLAFLLVHQDVPDDVVYEATELFVNEGESFTEPYGFWPEAFERDLLPGLEVYESIEAPVHPGYAQYWEDQGVDVPESVIP